MVSLSDLCEINIGRTPSRSVRKYWGAGAPWLSIADMNQGRHISVTKEQITESAIQDANMRLVPKGALLLSFKLSIGKVSIAKVPLYTNEAIAALLIRNSERVLPEYLYWCLKTIDLTAGQDRAAMGLTLNKAKLAVVNIPLPPMAVQCRIAAILDLADELRVKRREALAQLDSLTQSIFLEMFGNPVTNPKNCVASSLGEAISEMQYGPRFYDEAYSPEGVRIVRITDLDSSGGLDFDSMPRMAIDEETHSQYMLRPGDIVFARTGATVGKIALINQSAPPCIAGAYFIRLQFKNYLLPEYAYAALRTNSIQAIIAAQSRQAAQQNFSGPGLRRLPMPIPSLSLQHEFKSRMLMVYKSIEVHQKSLAQLSELFLSLQHRAFRDEL